MPRTATWKIIDWKDRPAETQDIPIDCPHCEREAVMTVGKTPTPIITIIGMGVIFDDASYQPSDNFFPTTIRCRNCRKFFTTDPERQSDVR